MATVRARSGASVEDVSTCTASPRWRALAPKSPRAGPGIAGRLAASPSPASICTPGTPRGGGGGGGKGKKEGGKRGSKSGISDETHGRGKKGGRCAPFGQAGWPRQGQ